MVKKMISKSIDSGLLSVSRSVADTYQSLALQPLSTRSTAQHACTPTLLPVPSVRYGRRPRRTTRGSRRGDAPALAGSPAKAKARPRPYPLRLGVLPTPAYCTPLSPPARLSVHLPCSVPCSALLTSTPLHSRLPSRLPRHPTPGRGDISRRQRGGLTRSAIPRPSGGDRPTKLCASSVCPSVRHRSPSPFYIRSPAVPFPPRCADQVTNDHPRRRPTSSPATTRACWVAIFSLPTARIEEKN